MNDKAFERGVLFGVGSDLQLTERLRRTGAHSMAYQFTVNAPSVYTRPWTKATPMRGSTGRSTSTHAYTVTNLLKGPRAQEK